MKDCGCKLLYRIPLIKNTLAVSNLGELRFHIESSIFVTHIHLSKAKSRLCQSTDQDGNSKEGEIEEGEAGEGGRWHEQCQNQG